MLSVTEPKIVFNLKPTATAGRSYLRNPVCYIFSHHSLPILTSRRIFIKTHLPSVQKYSEGQMEDATMGQHWCYMCSRMVSPIGELQNKCPFCEAEFVEEVSNQGTHNLDSRLNHAFSQFAPLFLGVMEGLNLPPALLTTQEFASNSIASVGEEETEEEEEREQEVALRSSRRRRRNSVSTISVFHQHPLVRMTSESNENGHSGRGDRIVVFDNNGEEAFVFRRSFDLINQTQHPSQNSVGSLSGLPVGQGFNVLLQRLMDNDPNRYGTPPTQKAAIKAMPAVIVEDQSQCSICLEDLEIGNEAKEMPCKHKYHIGCILSWLELHSCCPLCRFQMPTNEFKSETGDVPSTSGRDDQVFQFRAGTGSESYGRRYWLPVFWPYRNHFTYSRSTAGGSSTVTPSNGAVQEHASQDNLIEDD